MPDTLYVHIYGGPGSGKSTTRALVFGALKQDGYNVEESPEFAKDLTWEQRTKALGFQPYIFGKQTYRERRLEGEVAAVISDTSPLLSLIYSPAPRPAWWNSFTKFAIDYYRARRTLNILLERDDRSVYETKGRNESEEQARLIDNDIADLLLYTGTEYKELKVSQADNAHVAEIVAMIEERI